jgi:hypothetical protein
MKEYKSRRNKVTLTDEGIVRKEFSDKACCEKEALALRALNGCCAPPMLNKGDAVIETGLVEGDLLLDRYLRAAPGEAEKLAKTLAQTITYIYDRLHSITFDENFRNYIVKGDEIVRVDFEEITEGTLEEWCAKVCAFAALYEVRDRVKLAFIDTLCKNLPIDREAFGEEFKKEVKFLSDRWQAKTGS